MFLKDILPFICIVFSCVFMIFVISLSLNALNTLNSLTESESGIAYKTGYVDGWNNISQKNFDSEYIQMWYNRGYKSGRLNHLYCEKEDTK